MNCISKALEGIFLLPCKNIILVPKNLTPDISLDLIRYKKGTKPHLNEWTWMPNYLCCKWLHVFLTFVWLAKPFAVFLAICSYLNFTAILWRRQVTKGTVTILQVRKLRPQEVSRLKIGSGAVHRKQGFHLCCSPEGSEAVCQGS